MNNQEANKKINSPTPASDCWRGAVGAHLRDIVLNLPDSPGCYQYLDETGTIIYVGKAKNLKRRVYSYFSKEHENRKTAILVSKIRDIKYIVVKSEEDALLLENSLIKQWNPRYNILLKDGKTYPSIVVTKEFFPRIFQTRKIDKRYGTYFGPYSHIPTLRALLELIENLYPLRNCHEVISSDSIDNCKHKVCLNFHIRKCCAPCTGHTSHDTYMKYVAEAMEILKGNTRHLQEKMLGEMKALAEEMRFEEAEEIKRKYVLLENYCSRSEVVSNTLHNVDVFNIENDEKVAYVNYLHVVNGCITQAFTFELCKRLDETTEELLTLGIAAMRERYPSGCKEIIIPFPVELSMENITFTVPQKGDKKKLLELSKLNVLQYKKDRLTQSDKLNPEQKGVRLMKELQDALKLPTLPMRIECFDNSHIGGTNAVAGCVVFDKCKPNKSLYRKYEIKGGEGGDDYGSMQEVVRRRYQRIQKEEGTFPDLIIADGGIGQMNVIHEVLQELSLDIPIAGLAKNDKHRTNELLYGFPPQTVGVATNSNLFHLLTRIQDEVHRFAITFHRQKRGKTQTKSALDNIVGIGPKTKELLLQKFHSVKRIQEASREELVATIGEAKTNALLSAFQVESNEINESYTVPSLIH